MLSPLALFRILGVFRVVSHVDPDAAVAARRLLLRPFNRLVNDAASGFGSYREFVDFLENTRTG